MSVALARLYAKYEFHFFNHLSPTSYTIYLYHGIFQALSLQILMRFTHFDNVVYIILAFLSGVYGSFLVYKLLYGYCNSRFGSYLSIDFWYLSILIDSKLYWLKSSLNKPLEDSFFSFSTDVLMLSTCRVDGPHQWC